MDWSEYKDWVYRKYAKSWAPSVMTYSRKYSHILLKGDLKEIEKISPNSKNTSIKALVVLSKFLGVHEKFKAAMKSYGIKLYQPGVFGSFMRMYTNQSADLMDWFAKANSVLRSNERVYLKFLKLSGLRKGEGLTAFNKIIELFHQNIALHVSLRKSFLRGTT